MQNGNSTNEVNENGGAGSIQMPIPQPQPIQVKAESAAIQSPAEESSVEPSPVQAQVLSATEFPSSSPTASESLSASASSPSSVPLPISFPTDSAMNSSVSLAIQLLNSGYLSSINSQQNSFPTSTPTSLSAFSAAVATAGLQKASHLAMALKNAAADSTAANLSQANANTNGSSARSERAHAETSNPTTTESDVKTNGISSEANTNDSFDDLDDSLDEDDSSDGDDGDGDGDNEVDEPGGSSAKNLKIEGKSCHQCKTRRKGNLLVRCNRIHQKKGRIRKRKVELNVPPGERKCKKKYCQHCLAKFYSEQPPVKAGADWSCPGCRGMCSCASCKRQEVRREQKRMKKQAILLERQRVSVLKHQKNQLLARVSAGNLQAMNELAQVQAQQTSINNYQQSQFNAMQANQTAAAVMMNQQNFQNPQFPHGFDLGQMLAIAQFQQAQVQAQAQAQLQQAQNQSVQAQNSISIPMAMGIPLGQQNNSVNQANPQQAISLNPSPLMGTHPLNLSHFSPQLALNSIQQMNQNNANFASQMSPMPQSGSLGNQPTMPIFSPAAQLASFQAGGPFSTSPNGSPFFNTPRFITRTPGISINQMDQTPIQPSQPLVGSGSVTQSPVALYRSFFASNPVNLSMNNLSQSLQPQAFNNETLNQINRNNSQNNLNSIQTPVASNK